MNRLADMSIKVNKKVEGRGDKQRNEGKERRENRPHQN